MKKCFHSLCLLLLLHSNAYAASPIDQQSPIFFFGMIAVFVLFLYFTAWRPQNKRAKEHQALLSSLNKGDEVATSGGLLGKVNKVTDQFIELSLADAVDVIVQKQSIATLLPKGTLKSVR